MLNDKEIAELDKIWRDVNETSDFYKWQDIRRTAGLSIDFASWTDARDSALARQKADAEAGKRKRLAALEAERLAKQAKADQAKADAAIELSLAADKKRLQNQWLVDHPAQTPADFEKKAWHLLKENLIEQRRNESLEAEMRDARASMDFF